jgi:hypothetical protein
VYIGDGLYAIKCTFCKLRSLQRYRIVKLGYSRVGIAELAGQEMNLFGIMTTSYNLSYNTIDCFLYYKRYVE